MYSRCTAEDGIYDRRSMIYDPQVGATAAVLIASAAAELKRQQEQELEKEAAEAEAEAAASGGLGAMGSLSLSHSAGRLPSSAPPDVNAAAIAVMAGLEDRRAAEAEAAAAAAATASEEKTMDGMTEHEAYFPLSGGGGGGSDDGLLRGRASSLAEPRRSGAGSVLKPTSLTMKPRISPNQRWRVGVLGAPGGMMGASPGGGSIVGAGKLGVQCFTCTVGKKPSQAATYVNDIDEVLELLRGLVKVSSSVSRNYSTSHLSDMRGRGGGSANYEDLSFISAQFHAEVGVLGASFVVVFGCCLEAFLC